MNPPPLLFPLPMKGKATGLVSLTMLVTNLPGKYSLRIPTTSSSDLLSGVPIALPLIFVMHSLQGRAILLTPALPLMQIHQTFLNKILSLFTIKYIFLHKDIRYFIQLAINTHIDCVNNSKSVFGAFSKQQEGTLKVCCA